MKQLKLLSLIIRNFKGIVNFELITNGTNVTVYGDNAAGKTTLADALFWILFDKDSLNRKDFGVKTVDRDGNEIHRLEHEVTASFSNGGETVTLRKVYSEKWPKKRGSAAPEMDGHETKYWIDSVPRSKKEYDAFIAGIADESMFKLLTNPTYFNEQMSWQKRREILLNICGDVTDADVIAADKELAGLPKILGKRTLEDHRAVITARRTEINEELRKIPVRISEVHRGMNDVTGLDRAVLSTEESDLRQQQQDKYKEISRIESGGEISVKQTDLQSIESELIEIRNRYRQEYSDKIFAKKSKLQEIKGKIQSTQYAMDAKNRNLDYLVQGIRAKEKVLIELRNLFISENQKVFSFNGIDICPSCGQVLPVNQLEEATEKARAHFNLEHSHRIESIDRQGKETKAAIDDLKVKQNEFTVELEQAVSEKKTLEQEAVSLQTEINNIGEVPSLETDEKYIAAVNKKAEIQKQIEQIQNDKQVLIEGVKNDIAIIGESLADKVAKIAMIDGNEKATERIKVLESEQKTLSTEFERLEKELYLTERFIRTKVSLLTERINSKFQYARFKLFDIQVNGGLKECCEVTFNGVPFSTGLNNGARMNTGLDVINTLSDHYGFFPPIIIDNAESVTKLIPTKAQVIRLVVSQADKVLRVVPDDSKEQNLFQEAV